VNVFQSERETFRAARNDHEVNVIGHEAIRVISRHFRIECRTAPQR